jgi:hypothetical protein
MKTQASSPEVCYRDFLPCRTRAGSGPDAGGP